MSDTPRTDAVLHYEPTHQRENGFPVLLECVSAEFAKSLERENARLRETPKRLTTRPVAECWAVVDPDGRLHFCASFHEAEHHPVAGEIIRMREVD